MDDSCVGGDLRPELTILRSQFLVGLLRASRLLFKVRVRRGDRTESLYPATEFVSEVGVFMGQQPGFDAGFSSQLQGGEGPGESLRRPIEQALHGGTYRGPFGVRVSHWSRAFLGRARR
jgi:hypothetical protein